LTKSTTSPGKSFSIHYFYKRKAVSKMALTWSSNFSIGVPKVDEQHQELFRRTNMLLEACQSGKGKENVREMLDFLGNYVNSHFSYEEGLMKEYRYPEFSSHRALHEGFTQSFLKLKAEAEKGVGLTLVTQVNKTVVDWWVNHILKIDKQLGAFLQEKMR
ncbi:MAG: hemerythrin family protein, partial [Atribacterota bacterium]|nr:hemerythrin family protein [Atribacterota bacterium]